MFVVKVSLGENIQNHKSWNHWRYSYIPFICKNKHNKLETESLLELDYNSLNFTKVNNKLYASFLEDGNDVEQTKISNLIS